MTTNDLALSLVSTPISMLGASLIYLFFRRPLTSLWIFAEAALWAVGVVGLLQLAGVHP